MYGRYEDIDCTYHIRPVYIGFRLLGVVVDMWK